MKTVFSNNEIPHLWAHQTQPSGRNSNDSFYFRDTMIFSYRDSWCIAKWIIGKLGGKAVLFNCETYSHTTACHTNDVKRAIPFGTPIFYITDPTTRDVLKDYEGRIKDHVQYGVKPRIRQTTRDQHLAQIHHLVTEANRYAEFMGIKQRLALPESLEHMVAELEAAAKKRAAEAKRAATIRLKAEAREAAEYAVKHADCFDEWRAGTSTHNCCKHEEYYLRLPTGSAGVLLRYDADDKTIQTSAGAVVPVDHAKRAYQIVSKLKAAGKTYKRNGHTISIGHYPLDSVDEQGNVMAGCHLIKWDEIERLAVRMGWKEID